MKPSVYLAGAINGKDDAEVFGWRREAARQLADLYTIVDPSERDFRGIEETSIEEIVDTDIADINDVHVLLVRAEAPSWGTAMEVRHAHTQGIPVVSWGAGPRPSPWLLYHSTHYATLDDALTALVTIWRELWATVN